MARGRASAAVAAFTVLGLVLVGAGQARAARGKGMWSQWAADGGNLALLPALCINLNSSYARWEHISEVALPLLPRMQRLPGVDAKLASPDWTADERVSLRARDLLNEGGVRFTHADIGTIGAFGATMSHVAAWKQTIQSGELTFVMEDDVTITTEAIVQVRNIVRTRRSVQVLEAQPATVWLLRHDFKGQYSTEAMLGHDNLSPQVTLIPDVSDTAENGAYVSPQDQWHSVRRFVQMGGYIVTPEAARVLLDHAFPIDMHVDAYMSVLARLNLLHIVAVPNLNLEALQFEDHIGHPGILQCNRPSTVYVLFLVTLLVLASVGVTAAGLLFVPSVERLGNRMKVFVASRKSRFAGGKAASEHDCAL